MASNLVAYIPVLNRQYFEWLEKHEPFSLHVVSGEMAKAFLPRLGRNIGALSARDAIALISGLFVRKSPQNSVRLFMPECSCPSFFQNGNNWVMPDEDLSHLVANKYLFPKNCSVTFEPIWARYDMQAVKRLEPVLPDMEVSSAVIDRLRMDAARKLAPQTPDWWRQIGAIAFRENENIACSFIKHMPDEYVTALFGDPRINFDAGDPAGADVYVSLHAEKGLIGACARDGIKLKGASVYCTTFPCGDCARYLAECEIKELFFEDGYSIIGGFDTLKKRGIRIVKVVRID